jgi:hypothetical protein
VLSTATSTATATYTPHGDPDERGNGDEARERQQIEDDNNISKQPHS